MKNLKLIIASTFVSVIFMSAANAQERAQMNGSKKKELMEMREKSLQKLELTPEQKTKFDAVSKKYAEQMKDLSPTKEERIAKMKKLKAIQEQKDAEMKNVLSEAQFKTYLEIKKERKEEMKQRLKERRNH